MSAQPQFTADRIAMNREIEYGTHPFALSLIASNAFDACKALSESSEKLITLRVLRGSCEKSGGTHRCLFQTDDITRWSHAVETGARPKFGKTTSEYRSPKVRSLLNDSSEKSD